VKRERAIGGGTHTVRSCSSVRPRNDLQSPNRNRNRPRSEVDATRSRAVVVAGNLAVGTRNLSGRAAMTPIRMRRRA
jgi:hypothetical protein